MMTADAREAVRERLERLAASNGGRLTPEAVVEDARRKESPLHQHFTWDVRKAAHQHWLDQARSLITSIRIEMRTETTVVSSVAYVRDPAAGKEQGYISVAALRTDKDLAREALVIEFGRVADMLRRARELAVTLDATADVDDLLERTVGLRQRFMEAPVQKQ